MSKHNLSIIAVLLILFSACGEGTKSDPNRPKLPNAIGHMGELVIVADETVHDGSIWQVLDTVFDAPQPYLFNAEGFFRIFDVRPKSFHGVYKSYSSILVIKIQGDGFDTRKSLPAPYNTLSDSLKNANDTAPVRIYLKKNVWAYPQQVMFLYAKSHEILHEYLLKNRNTLLDRMLDTELQTFAVSNKNERQDTIGTFVKEKFGFTMDVPQNFRIAKFENIKGKKFAWIRRETPNISQGLLLYTQPYTREDQLSNEEIVLARDSVCMKHIPGNLEGSYMATELAFPFLGKVIDFEGHYTKELRALWKTENDFMGGPFYSITMVDTAHSQLITVEGFVYSPRYDKTQYLRQMEVIVKSVKWD